MAARQKRKGAKRTRKAKSHGLWIAPDLERTIKGEGGRRGLSEPPYGYYLQLADLALKSWGSSAPQQEAADTAHSPFSFEEDKREPSPTVGRPRRKSLKTAAPLRPSPQFRVATQGRPPKIELPKTESPKPPKLAAPKPPKRQSMPKLSVPKPPKRRK